uniref:Serine/threonine-protein phosphatase 2A activator n=1 Tax=Mucochytrium quahogii TaxID=96639 RepID=A0A7S2R8T0_9STRA|mmetsp:Transcript_5725/g.8894  ORF Transcript_5725/g.8894 Transcript_5725/m.8894 type:complete len:638 (+) Transcript_5725:180-2093(+)|eukprot:CAMPEP_0203749622 /NCGR_PEP_ID=MMETSP0098-20131031/4108_1 /ASSEMBLY_ACC=CAM_ASM_000208 /TAXON_ID=96639 /ORGANISM=" , Strain NY0313808BC1" /LENGTH=637 /DNA_ID=CAMNT_0050638703 /DNA_START=142 /DNA_END=2055 /DNA_ORIENTATION=-
MSTDSVPRRRISNQVHLQAFLKSETCDGLVAFLENLNAAAIGKRNWKGSENGCPEVAEMCKLLERALDRISDFPPVKENARFGNSAFRSWLDAIKTSSVDEMEVLSGEHKEELAGYWWNSFGNGKRLDFGTGHEASFLVWLYAVFKMGHCSNLEAMVLYVFPKYLKVVRKLQAVYRLEPAGSHGVWSFDDFHLLPFLFGSAQFCQVPTSEAIAPSPKSAQDFSLVEQLAENNMYMDAMYQVYKVKKANFPEHSPLLCDLGKIRSWEEINRGLVLMFKGEVLEKFPVAQHFLFGSLFPCTWEVSAEDIAALDSPQVEQDAKPVYKSPFTDIKHQGGGGDMFAKYFGITRKPMYKDGGKTVSGNTSGATEDHALLSPPRTGIKIKGWVVETKKTHISSDHEIEAAKQGNEHMTSELDFPLPEMLFGKNFARFTHVSSGMTLEFNALDALCECKIKTTSDGEACRNVFKLPNAKSWSNRKDFNGEEIKEWRSDFDWTYTSTYGGTLKGRDRVVSKEHKIDYERLKLREPILFFDNVTLYEDDLFDNGESKLSCKLRVMPSCFFALARMWLRVDNTYLRSFDTRIYHEFGKDFVVVERTRKEADMATLRSLGCLDAKSMMDEAKVETLLPLIHSETEIINV